MNTVTSTDGTTIAYDRRGQGPAVIVVDGALSLRQSKQELAELLAPRFTVYNYDRRGRGDSGDTRPYGVAREVEDIAAAWAPAGIAGQHRVARGGTQRHRRRRGHRSRLRADERAGGDRQR